MLNRKETKMSLFEIVLLSIGLAMDAFAVAICKGLALKKINFRHVFVIGLYFGVFQALMPLIGYYLGESFNQSIEKFNHFISFILLFLIGLNMVVESFSKEEDVGSDLLQFKEMLLLAIATSIDALAVGVTLSFYELNIFSTIAIIGFITFVLSCIGVCLGNKMGMVGKQKAEFFGGITLIGIGTKLLLEGLHIIDNVLCRVA